MKKTIFMIIMKDFRDYFLHAHDKELSPMPVNFRVRTMRALNRYFYTKGYLNTPIHENFKPVKAPEDTLESFTQLKQRTFNGD
ncbi:hypothetical protein [Neobacillus drentensis]|uniref:hypothetical protein n=1 Tax=Neobacillus drentensis TaxID=220684 RepID=UPI00082627FC|nr:hypothetical protein [Neobacillus drentensis]